MPPVSGERVLVAMSGGVDSAVAAAILLEQGHDLIGCFMRLGELGESVSTAGSKVKLHHRGCCSISDAGDARRVCDLLGIPFYAADFSDEFSRIVEYFEAEYHAGRTPNPCVRCNDWLKFGRLFDYAQAMGASWVATGHHARIDHSSGSARLQRGADLPKDQSYVLFGQGCQRLERMLLPVGHMTKDQVREHARAEGLPVASKPDSMEICFVPDTDYAGLLKRRAPEQFMVGPIVDESGRTLGTHEGHQNFTIGQRRGLNLAFGEPRYVTAKDPDTNTVVIGPRSSLNTAGCVARDAVWHIEPQADWLPCRAQVRAHGDALPARVRATDSGALEVEFATPQEAVAAGQAIVCYQGDLVCCGGWIEGTLAPSESFESNS
ncbi:MAG: tRNA 2-thiouridine(34) synthase MnmA [Phycisphaerales bacterium]|nr:tRNA 2-thiouridine(34) synthase MnmA [Phycisphaerales bacterium]